MVYWTKKSNGIDEASEYTCRCGNIVGDEEYNADTGTYTCMECGSESPDTENICYMELISNGKRKQESKQ